MMGLLADFGLLAFGGLVLYLGAEWLVKGAAGLARTFGIREIVVGLTVVAYGTSAPELAVSISANLDGSSPMVFGNVVGSCIANMGLILGVTAVISPPEVDPSLIRREIPILVLSAGILPVMLIGGLLNRIEAAFLLAMAVGFTAWTLLAAKGAAALAAHEVEATQELEDAMEAGGAPTHEGTWQLVLITLGGLALLVGGGEAFLRGAKGIASYFGMSERLIGLTVVAFGTSLPELAASLVAALRGHSGLAVGNVVGSNIFNIFLVVGASGTIRSLPGDLSNLTLDFYFLIGVTLFCAFAMRKRRNISRLEGLILLSTYTAFIVLAATGW